MGENVDDSSVWLRRRWLSVFICSNNLLFSFAMTTTKKRTHKAPQIVIDPIYDFLTVFSVHRWSCIDDNTRMGRTHRWQSTSNGNFAVNWNQIKPKMHFSWKRCAPNMAFCVIETKLNYIRFDLIWRKFSYNSPFITVRWTRMSITRWMCGIGTQWSMKQI